MYCNSRLHLAFKAAWLTSHSFFQNSKLAIDVLGVDYTPVCWLTDGLLVFWAFLRGSLRTCWMDVYCDCIQTVTGLLMGRVPWEINYGKMYMVLCITSENGPLKSRRSCYLGAVDKRAHPPRKVACMFSSIHIARNQSSNQLLFIANALPVRFWPYCS